MTRCVVLFKDSDQFVNLDADAIEENGGFIRIYKNAKLVGIFQSECIKAVYKTEKLCDVNNGKFEFI